MKVSVTWIKVSVLDDDDRFNTSCEIRYLTILTCE